MFSSIGNLIGGLGLLLIGMSLMTDGLKLAAGNTLRDILALWTNTRTRGLFSGFLITGIVQSSSAVTVATIGFANAGMLSLEKALWVIFGSNVGTTMTAWIVALIGFKLNIEALALPLIGVGAILKLTGKESRRAFTGQAIVGFGLLFLGIGFLKSAFESLAGNIGVAETQDLTVLIVLTYLLLGFGLTTLMQSSSAAMVVALSAAESGLVPLNIAAAIVIGANLGTTTTALISVFGATSTAKRVALGHVSFNLITGFVAVIMLGPMLWLSIMIQSVFGLGASPAISLALFHTTFNVLGVLLMWPLSDRMVKMLYRKFQTQEETESRPKFLDKNVLALPYIAVDALTLELSRIATMCVELFQKSLHAQNMNLKSQSAIIRNLAGEIGKFSAGLNKTELTPYISEVMMSLMHSMQEYMLTIEISEDIAQLGAIARNFQESVFVEELEAFISAAAKHLDSLTPDNAAELINSPDSYDVVESTYDILKKSILTNTSFGNLGVSDMDLLLQYANQVKRGCRHLRKAARRLNTARESLQRNPEGNVIQSSTSDQSNIEKIQDAEQTLVDDEQSPELEIEKSG